MSLKPKSSLRMKRIFGPCQAGGRGGGGGQVGGGGAGTTQVPSQLGVLNSPLTPASVHCVPSPFVVPADGKSGPTRCHRANSGTNRIEDELAGTVSARDGSLLTVVRKSAGWNGRQWHRRRQWFSAREHLPPLCSPRRAFFFPMENESKRY